MVGFLVKGSCLATRYGEWLNSTASDAYSHIMLSDVRDVAFLVRSVTPDLSPLELGPGLQLGLRIPIIAYFCVFTFPWVFSTTWIKCVIWSRTVVWYGDGKW